MKNRGFTLIEVVVVLAIIGVLFAVVYPDITARQKHDNEKELNTQITVIQKALNLCYALEGNYPPETWVSGGKSGNYIDYLVMKKYLLINEDYSEKYFDSSKYTMTYNSSTGEFNMTEVK